MKSQADGSADRSKLILLVAMALGSTFLLAANPISTREAKPDKAAEEASPSPPPSVLPKDRVTELSTAAYLMQVALEQARAINKHKPGT